MAPYQTYFFMTSISFYKSEYIVSPLLDSNFFHPSMGSFLLIEEFGGVGLVIVLDFSLTAGPFAHIPAN